MERQQRNRAEAVVRRLMGTAPKHIMLPQIEELARLSPEQLAVLENIQQLPLGDDLRKKILDAFGGDDHILVRLEKRCEVAESIRKADEAGSYEINEHLASVMGLSTKQTLSASEVKEHFDAIINSIDDLDEYVITRSEGPDLVLMTANRFKELITINTKLSEHPR